VKSGKFKDDVKISYLGWSRRERDGRMTRMRSKWRWE